jgi:hypothetical protein
VRNDVLGRHVIDAYPKIGAHHFLHVRDQKHEAWALGARKAAEREHNATLVLAEHLDGSRDNDHGNDNDGNKKCEGIDHVLCP